MSLKEKWNDLIGNANANVALVNEYYNKETEAYKSILSDTSNIQSGTLHELAQRFDMSDVIFTGFIDGANDSLKQGYDIDSLTEDTAINLDFDYEKLFYNMLKAKAKWLSSLPEWETVLSEESRREITKQYRLSGMAVSGKTVGRNDPCPCGSGKKYKNCHGKRA